MFQKVNLGARILMAFAIFLSTFSIFILQVDAQSYRGLIVDKYNIDFGVVQPGDVLTGDFTLTYNYAPDTDGNFKEVTLDATSKNFTQGENAGVPKFLGEDEVSPESSLADWITMNPQQVSMNQNGQETKVTFTVKVPENAEPGGKYAAVIYGNNSGEDAVDELARDGDGSFGFGLSSELGVLVFLTVDGDNSIDIATDSIYPANIRGDRRFFFISTPVNIVASIENNGNVHGIPRGLMYVGRPNQQIFEVPDEYIYQFNDSNSLVLPQTTRNYSETWMADSIYTQEIVRNEETGAERTKYNFDWRNENVPFGFYKASLQLSYESTDGSMVESKIKSTTFLVIPLPLLITIIVALLAVIGAGGYLYYKNRSSAKGAKSSSSK